MVENISGNKKSLPTEPNIRFDFSIKVLEISRRHEIVETRKTGPAKDNVESVKRDLGWFIRISQHISVFVGMEEPDIKIGDQLRLILFKPDAGEHLLHYVASEAEYAKIDKYDSDKAAS